MKRAITLSFMLLAAGAPGARAHEGHKAVWISHAGGQVRHSEFRMDPPVHNAKPMQEPSRPGMPK